MKKILVFVQLVLFALLLLVLFGVLETKVPPAAILVALVTASCIMQVLLWDQGWARHRPFRVLLHGVLKNPQPSGEVWRHDQVDQYAEMLIEAAYSATSDGERDELIEAALEIIREYDLDMAALFARPRSMYVSLGKRHGYELTEWDGGREILAYLATGHKPERYNYPHGHIRAKSELVT